MANDKLGRAKIQKNDEFYTQYEDIQTELNHYEIAFNGKTVLCNCDDPFESNFTKFFLKNFNYLKLKRLICTSYTGSPVAGTQMSLFDDCGDELVNEHGYVMDITSIPMQNGRGISDADIDRLLNKRRGAVKKLKGSGDFQSEECIEYLKQADIVVTNPPFSLFKEYFAQLMEYNKRFIIIGTLNAMKYKEIFPYYIDNRVWFGATMFNGGATYFIGSADLYDPKKMSDPKHAYIKNGKLYWRVNGVRWSTNLDHNKRHEQLILYARYSIKDYQKYCNYDAIEVSDVLTIPNDYSGLMGVPISFMDKYNPDQFDIIGLSNVNGLLDGVDIIGEKWISEYKEHGGTGHITANMHSLVGFDLDGKPVSYYTRVIVRNKYPEKGEQQS